MMEKDEHHCVVCGEYYEKSALYCSACGNYLHTNYFEFLGVSQDADTKTIRDAFLKQAIQCRPEKTAHLSLEQKEAAAQKLQKLNDIWEALGDEQKRLEYLMSLQQKECVAEPAQRRSLEALLWRRWCARFIDYILFAALLSPLLQGVYPGLFEGFMLGFSQSEHLKLAILSAAFGMAAVGAWVPFEVLFLSTLGTTPGKWLFQMQVVGSSSQTKLPIKAALSRAMQVWGLGMAMGLVFLIPIANGFWHYRFKKGQRAYWDAQLQCEIIEQPLSVFRVAASSMITLQSFALGFLLLGPLPSRVDTNYAYKAAIEAKQEQAQPAAIIEPLQAVKPLVSIVPATPQPKEESTLSAEPQTEETAEPAIASTKSALSSNHGAVSLSESVAASELVQPKKTGIVLPPSMRRDLEASNEKSLQTDTAHAGSAHESRTQTAIAPVRQLSQEQRLACAQRYYETMSEADDLPLGDYARINRQASEQRDRCLVGG